MGHSVLDTRGTESVSDRALGNPEKRAAIRSGTRQQKQALRYHWPFWARANQLLCLSIIWTVWVIQAGRGWGKTRVGAQSVIDAVEKCGCRRIALIGATFADVQKTMIMGESGIIAKSRPGNVPRYYKTENRLEWPNGAQAFGFTSEKPDRIRGNQFDFAWVDELAVFRFVEATWNNLMAALRLTTGPCRVVVTSTPNRTCPFMKALAAAEGTFLTKGPTNENLRNLHENIKKDMKRLEGTALGLQEYGGEDIGNADGAKFTSDMIDADRIRKPEDIPKLSWFLRIAIGADPNTTKSKDADDVGLCVAGLGPDGDTYILGEFGKDGKVMGPREWAPELVRIAELYKAREIVPETNAGGDMIDMTIENYFSKSPGKQLPKIVDVRSKQSKLVRAEPVVALMTAHRIHFCGNMPRLEAQLTGWVEKERGAKSPGAFDSFVIVVNHLNDGVGPVAAVARPIDKTLANAIAPRHAPRRF